IALPNRSLDGLWETLVFEEPIPEYLLRTIIRMISLSEDPRLGPADMCWHNLILLHGPPGSGKSTLAKGLAQKLSIRLASVYPVTKFIEVKSHALLSKFFGESGKLVGKLFDAIVGASVDDNLLTVVLIDEVESLAASRAKASQANDISDAIRSTNELLRGIDKLRSRPNVVLVCTSNLIENMDLAFVDRCGVKQYVGEPNFEAAYEIVRSVINKLIKTGLVYFTLTMDCGQECGSNSQSTNISSNSYPSQLDEVSPSLESESPNLTEDLNSIPELAWARLQLSHHGNTTAAKLESISQLATGLSGRTLRRLPWLALARYTVDEPCSLAELLTALEKVVLEEAQSSTPEETESKVDEELTKKGHAGSVQDQTSSDTDDLLAHEMEGILKDMTRLGGL
ncbi:P-loop containing nucleoside triphosphate hydrolase protein, partial [Massariosphaeria phaeospora]